MVGLKVGFKVYLLVARVAVLQPGKNVRVGRLPSLKHDPLTSGIFMMIPYTQTKSFRFAETVRFISSLGLVGIIRQKRDELAL